MLQNRLVGLGVEGVGGVGVAAPPPPRPAPLQLTINAKTTVHCSPLGSSMHVAFKGTQEW